MRLVTKKTPEAVLEELRNSMQPGELEKGSFSGFPAPNESNRRGRSSVRYKVPVSEFCTQRAAESMASQEASACFGAGYAQRHREVSSGAAFSPNHPS